ncbi:MAG: hypothetical protein RI973_303 [Bacteroidota bacterium]|jgi:thiamine-monophosphate kinase
MMLENSYIKSFAGDFARSPLQLNQLHEADAELINPEALAGEILVLKVDGLADEIQAGLYENPYVIGWTAVNASLSDLAAVGAAPIGLLLQLQTPHDLPESTLKALSQGIREACEYHRTYLLGGDTNHGKVLDVSMTAIGRTPRPMLRKGCQPGDALFCSGPMGYGNAYAFARIFQHQTLPYRPVARIGQGRLIRDYASCCIDSSDGFFPALAQLSEVNPCGFSMEIPFEDMLDDTAAAICMAQRIPSWIMLAGPHGEYELVFTVGEDKLAAFQQAAAVAGMNFIRLGRCQEKPVLSFRLEQQLREIHPADIANLYEENASDPNAYFKKLQKLNQSWLQQS